MRKDWKSAKLKDICEFKNGLWTGKKPPFQRVAVIRNTNFTKDGQLDYSDIVYLDVEQSQYAKRKLEPGDIIIEKSGGGPKQPVGRVVLFDKSEGEYSFSNFTSAIRVLDKSKVDCEYLHRCLNALYISGVTEKLQNHSTGIRNLKFDEYKELDIPLPKLAEQKRIVALLDDCFAAIAKAKVNAEQNLRNAQELFENVVKNVFQQGNIDTTIGDQITLQRGFDITKSQQSEGNIPVVSSGGIKSFHNVAMVQGPGVVIGRKGTLGKVFFLEDDFWPHDTTLWVKDFRGNLPKFVYYFFKGFDVTHLDSGAANPALNRNLLHPIKVKWVATQQQPEIVFKLDKIFEKTENLKDVYRSKLEQLDHLQKTVLQKAFAGEMVVDKMIDV